jgi:3-isopropylmalate/(R)-2-methylmalate dehydratase large subunit
MSIEMGARGGMIAPDQTTFDYIKGRLFAPQGADWDKKLAAWKELYTDADAKFDVEINIKAADIDPMITYGTNPGMGLSVRGTLPTIESFTDATEKQNYEKALAYMGLKAGQSLLDMPVQNVFIGSCTNSRIEDFRLVASIIKGKQKDPNIKTLIVPGSQEVAKQIKAEGLDKIFAEAGVEIRQAGCSACLGMNEDKIPAGEYCISTSNRNFEGRQGAGARTLLASPLTAAAALLTGKITDIRDIL